MTHDCHNLIFRRFQGYSFENFDVLVFGVVELHGIQRHSAVEFGCLPVGARSLRAFILDLGRCDDHDRHFVGGTENFGDMLDVVGDDGCIEHERAHIK